MSIRQFSKKWFMKIISVFFLFLFIFGLASACANNSLKFESIKLFYGDIQQQDTMVFVVSNKDSRLPESIDQQYWRQVIDSVDFSKYIILFIFRGRITTGSVFNVTNVKENTNSIIITAKFLWPDTYTASDEIVSPVEVIKIDKSRMHGFGQLTFKLLDTQGKERARVISEISP
jgi:hypothetical protein